MTGQLREGGGRGQGVRRCRSVKDRERCGVPNFPTRPRRQTVILPEQLEHDGPEATALRRNSTTTPSK